MVQRGNGCRMHQVRWVTVSVSAINWNATSSRDPYLLAYESFIVTLVLPWIVMATYHACGLVAVWELNLSSMNQNCLLSDAVWNDLSGCTLFSNAILLFIRARMILELRYFCYQLASWTGLTHLRMKWPCLASVWYYCDGAYDHMHHSWVVFTCCYVL